MSFTTDAKKDIYFLTEEINNKETITTDIQEEVADIILEDLENNDIENFSTGKVISIKDGVAFCTGLSDIQVGELVEFLGNQNQDKKIYGMALNLEPDKVGIILFEDDTYVKQDDNVISLKRLVNVAVGTELLGRVLDPLGNPIDGLDAISSPDYLNIERKAPGVITRQSIELPLLTGYKIVDSLLPIGKGQRELIIGDRQTGKTTIALDTILNQKFYNQEDLEMFCVYVGIGQKKSSILNLQNVLTENKAFHYTVIVAATAAQNASLLFIAPYTGCSIAEYFRDKGLNSLIIYDDLSKHAAAYRQLSLLLRRPPGREAFPGDVFYTHSRLLERACKLNENYGGGSLTALPIVETQAGDLSGYIPTNIISITDGQIFVEKGLFFKGIRPAVNVGSSVSRVGSKAQPFALKMVTGNIKYQLAQFREYSVFAQFDNDLDAITKGILNKGSLLTETLKQTPYKPLELYKQTIIILASAFGYIDGFIKDYKKDLHIVLDYEKNLYEFLVSQENLFSLFQPLFSYLHYAKKEDFSLKANPFIFCINYFNKEYTTMIYGNRTSTSSNNSKIDDEDDMGTYDYTIH